MSWRGQQGGGMTAYSQQWGTKSQNRNPPQHGYQQWQSSVPSWEKEFCRQVPWPKVVEINRYMDLYKNIFQWNDSAGKEAFNSRKSRFWAEINGLPTCNMPLPDPDVYIDDIDWNASSNDIDPEVILDMERGKETKPFRDDHCGETLDQDHEVVVLGLHALHSNQWAFVRAGWADGFADEDLKIKENVPEKPWDCGKRADNKKNNPWEHAAFVYHQSNAAAVIGAGWDNTTKWNNNNSNMMYYGRADDRGVSNYGNFKSDTANYSRKRSYGTGGSWYNNSMYYGRVDGRGVCNCGISSRILQITAAREHMVLVAVGTTTQDIRAGDLTIVIIIRKMMMEGGLGGMEEGEDGRELMLVMITKTWLLDEAGAVKLGN